MRVYAERGDKEQVLVALRCDDCDVEVKPGPGILVSGWIKTIYEKKSGDLSESHFCPQCAEKRGLVAASTEKR